MKFPFTIVRYFSRKNTPKRGRSGSRGKAVTINQVVLVKRLIPIIAKFDLDNPSKMGYVSAVKAVTSSFIEVRQIKSSLELGVILIFEVCEDYI